VAGAGGSTATTRLGHLLTKGAYYGAGVHGATRVRSHCRFRNRGTDYLSESGIEWMSGSTKRQCDRALGATPSGTSRYNSIDLGLVHLVHLPPSRL
jgi:hypothetical protein